MKIRKFRAGDMVVDTSDAEEDKAKTAGLAASNAEKKSSGFLGLGRLFQGNIDEKGSEAYNKYGAGYGRKIEAENDRLKAATLRETAAPAETKPTAPAETKPAAASRSDDGSYDALEKKRFASPAPASKSDNSYADLEKKRLASPRSTVSPGVTRVTEDMPKTKPAGGGQVTTGDARGAEYANAFPSNRDEGVRAAKRGPGATTGSGTAAAKPPAAAAKPPAAAAEAGNSRGSRAPEAAPAAAAEAGNSRGSRAPAPAGSRQAEAGNSRGSRPAAAKPAAQKQLSQAQQRAQAAVARATGNSSGSASSSRVPTAAEAGRNIASVAGKAGDAVSSVGNYFKNFETPAERRSRLAKEAKDKERSKFMEESGQKAGGGAIRGYASGGSVSASRRGDGIAQRGKTRGKMC